MTLYEQLKKLELSNRSKGNNEVADRIKKMIEETPVKIGILPVAEEED